MLAPVSLAAAYNLARCAWPADRLPIEIHWTGEQEGMTQRELQDAIEGTSGRLRSVEGPQS